MSMNPQYETYRYTGEICLLRGQSVVECRLPGTEINAVLAVHATATVADVTCLDGETKASGKLCITVVYEDADRRVCRVERGAEFFVNGEDPSVTPACFARTSFTVKSVRHRREGSGVYLVAVVESETRVFGTKTIEYFTGGDDFFTQKKEVAFVRNVQLTHQTELEDEFETEYFADVLAHSEQAFTATSDYKKGDVVVDGDVLFHLCALTEDNGLKSYEKRIPFTAEIACDETGVQSVRATPTVVSASVKVETDAEKGRAKIVVSLVLSLAVTLYVFDRKELPCDAFCESNETTLKKENVAGRYLFSSEKLTKTVSCPAVFSGNVEEYGTLLGVTLPRVFADVKKDGDEHTIEGAVEADAVFVDEEGNHRSAILSVPLSIALPVGKDCEVQTEQAVYGLKVTKKASGGAEAELVVCVKWYRYASVTAEYVAEVVVGQPYEENPSAITVFVPREGENLWQTAKRLKRAPDKLQAENPTLVFPIEKGARIVVYRQKE